ncbi:MAG: hypothetical protein JWN70_3298 [Planctomycetaceae bacterium]|nr:hypothetical protein [Planctomycetaceae bacterium]
MTHGERPTLRELKSRALELLTQIPGSDPELSASLAEDINAGEVGLALELLCDQLEVYQVPLSTVARTSVHALGVDLGDEASAKLIDSNPLG